MNPHRVKTRADLEKYLTEQGFVKTGHTTGTSEFWRSVKTGKHVQIPDAYQDGMFPEYYLQDLYDAVERITVTPPLH